MNRGNQIDDTDQRVNFRSPGGSLRGKHESRKISQANRDRGGKSTSPDENPQFIEQTVTESQFLTIYPGNQKLQMEFTDSITVKVKVKEGNSVKIGSSLEQFTEMNNKKSSRSRDESLNFQRALLNTKIPRELIRTNSFSKEKAELSHKVKMPERNLPKLSRKKESLVSNDIPERSFASHERRHSALHNVVTAPEFKHPPLTPIPCNESPKNELLLDFEDHLSKFSPLESSTPVRVLPNTFQKEKESFSVTYLSDRPSEIIGIEHEVQNNDIGFTELASTLSPSNVAIERGSMSESGHQSLQVPAFKSSTPVRLSERSHDKMEHLQKSRKSLIQYYKNNNKRDGNPNIGGKLGGGNVEKSTIQSPKPINMAEEHNHDRFKSNEHSKSIEAILSDAKRSHVKINIVKRSDSQQKTSMDHSLQDAQPESQKIRLVIRLHSIKKENESLQLSPSKVNENSKPAALDCTTEDEGSAHVLQSIKIHDQERDLVSFNSNEDFRTDHDGVASRQSEEHLLNALPSTSTPKSRPS